jgi:ribulose-phosphate 3-epimerase
LQSTIIRRALDVRGTSVLRRPKRSVDGGVNDVIGKRLAEAGADVLVAGSYIFNALNPLERIDSLYKL